MKQLLMLCLMTLGVMFACSPSQESNQDAPSTDESANSDRQGLAFVDEDTGVKTILQIAIGSPDHTTLVAAVKAAQMENVLANSGPLTVFAPTNAAFEKLPKGTLDELLKPENKAKLSRIITNHAAPGTYEGDGLKDGMKLFMATGVYLPVTNKDGKIEIDGHPILATIHASNGVVHVIDGLLLPPEK